MIRLNRVSKDYGGDAVLERVSCELHPEAKVGLVGRNGAGKTTLLRLLLGLEEPSRGQVERQGSLRLGFSPQELPRAALGLDVRDWLLERHRELRRRLERHERRLGTLSGAELERELASYQRTLDAFEAEGGEAVADKAEGLLDSLGLQGRMGQLVGSLSGGERNLLGMARALLDDPDVLVLDEPGNHLDFEGLDWLERFLSQHRGGLLIVSHNRYLLDRVVGRIWELEGGRLSEYAGNYSDYRLDKLGRLASQQADYAANQRRLTQLEQLVRRLAEIARVYDSPAAGKRLRAKRKQLERERSQAVARPELDGSKIELRVSSGSSHADIAVAVERYQRRVGSSQLFEDASLLVRCGERLALVGPNGCGKSTFLRDLVDHGAWDHPALRVGPSLRVGYCAQHLAPASTGATLLDFLVDRGASGRDRAFAVASRYLFEWSDLDRRVTELSGGEKNRLQLCALELDQPTLIILDEPTNHLDVFAREAIEDTLLEFEGTLLLVSHDRYLLEKLDAQVVEIRERGFQRFEGGFTEYFRARQPPRPRAAARRKGAPRRDARVRSQSASDIERRIGALEAERQELERRMAAAFDRGDHSAARGFSARLASSGRSLRRLYDEWVEQAEG